MIRTLPWLHSFGGYLHLLDCPVIDLYAAQTIAVIDFANKDYLHYRPTSAERVAEAGVGIVRHAARDKRTKMERKLKRRLNRYWALAR